MTQARHVTALQNYLVSMNVLTSQIAFDCPRTPSTLKDLEITRRFQRTLPRTDVHA